MAKFRIVGISFDHMHMGDLLRLVHDHPEAEIAGIYDPDRRKWRPSPSSAFPPDRFFTDFDACMAAGPLRHGDPLRRHRRPCGLVERLAPHVHVFVEKPFAASVADARRMMRPWKEPANRWPSTGRCAGWRAMSPPSA
jgi:predicted dehydrogenase